MMIAREEKKKKEGERGECSAGLDGSGARAPKRQRGVDQRLGEHAPGSSCFHLFFKSDRFEQDKPVG